MYQIKLLIQTKTIKYISRLTRCVPNKKQNLFLRNFMEEKKNDANERIQI